MIPNQSVFKLMAYLFFAYAIMNIVMSYMPIYFTYQGISARELGILLAVGPLASIFAQPFWGYMSDKFKSIKRILLIVVVGTLATALVLFQMNNFTGYTIMMFVLFLFLAPVTALGDSLSQKTALQHKVNFGRIRMWGSLGFAVASLLAGYYLTFVGIQFIMYPILFMTIFALLFAFLLHDVKTTNKPVTILHAVKLGANPRLFAFLLIIVFVSITHRANDTYLGIFITELGGRESIIGWAWFIGVVSEALVFFATALWFRKFKPITFLMISAILYSIRWFLMGAATTPETLLVLQALHGVTFGIFYIAAFQIVSKLVPEELQATGHVLFITTFFGISGIIGAFVGGLIIQSTGVAQLYSYLGFLSLIGCIGLLIYKFITEHRFGNAIEYSKS
ncbi:MFS transporter [Alkalihalophilus pseudofirmus]|uniref:MFS transporter n=1 Tax=Alkalihalobacterium alkalinitrilicum TaxID=427920 RepID=UPI00094D8FA2|nr:MFS transporter [Alkalihalobacterium alkalinitrilicum]OLO40386.1 MFS transporter [Alkalihalophilus pseudofirmus]